MKRSVFARSLAAVLSALTCFFVWPAQALAEPASAAAAPVYAETTETAVVPTVRTTVLDITLNGDALLALSPEELKNAGYELGDTVSVTVGSFRRVMPFLNGYYVEPEEYLLLAYPNHKYVSVCLNYGDISEAAGTAKGDPVTISLQEKAGARELQEANNLVYTDDISDYGGDEVVFANFRAVRAGKIQPGRLFRSASPVRNRHGRSAYADRLIREAGIKTVMNLADKPEEVASTIESDDYASPYYAQLFAEGRVTALSLPVNYRSPSFGNGIVRGLTFLSEGDTPLLVHCEEGKDRAGFTAMVLEMLGGASLDEIVQDYMISYRNYYDIQKGTEKYDLVIRNNLDGMIRHVCGLEKDVPLESVDLKAGVIMYLKNNGMTDETVNRLIRKLLGPGV